MPQRQAIKPQVFIAGEFVPTAHVVSIERVAGGAMANRAVIQLDLGKRHERIMDRVIGTYAGKTVEITALINGVGKVLHWGSVQLEEPSIGEEEERLTLVSLIHPKHFGRPIRGQRVVTSQFDSAANTLSRSHEDIVFNPEVDGHIWPNMRVSSGNVPLYDFLFVSPESTRTIPAKAYQAVSDNELVDPLGFFTHGVRHWTPAHVVRYLCQDANPLEVYIQNPTFGELQAALGSGDEAKSSVQNHYLPHGMMLPEALDSFLSPYGMSWYVKLVSPGVRKIVCYKLGVGQQKTVGLQRPGATFVRAQTNTADFNIAYSDGARVNQVRCVGSKKVVEASFICIPAWEPSYDGDDPFNEQFCSDQPEWHEHPETQRVWRDFVLNEAGDYDAMRPGVDRPPDLNDLVQYGPFELVDGQASRLVARRRKFKPTLTLGPDGAPIGKVDGVLIEIYNPLDPDAVDGWTPLRPEEDPSHHCQVLDRECGIRFSGAEPPYEFFDLNAAGYDMKVRVTATIELEIPAHVVAVNQGIDETAELFLDMSGRYHSRYLFSGAESTQVKQSRYLTQVQAGDLRAIQIDGSFAMALFAKALRDAWDQADVSGTIVLEGLDLLTDYEIGDVLTGITGRNVTTPANLQRSDVYPQIFGIHYAVQGQKTILTLNSHRQLDSTIASVISNRRQGKTRRELV